MDKALCWIFPSVVTILVVIALVLTFTSIPKGEGSVLVDKIEDISTIQDSRFFSIKSVVSTNGGFLVILSNEQVLLWNIDDYYEEKERLGINGQ